ncbi:hypothetical protein STEG23_034910 [Scotinomys teguina]
MNICLSVFDWSQHPEKPFTGKEDLDCERHGDPDSNPEAHLPSICLKQVFPKYAKQFNYLRLVDRMANLFIRFLGIKGTMKLGPTGFRTFIRNCKLSSGSLSMAAVDILYIDITRRWNSVTLDQRDSGWPSPSPPPPPPHSRKEHLKPDALQGPLKMLPESSRNLCLGVVLAFGVKQ